MFNKHFAFMSLGVCLFGGLGVAQAEDSASGSSLFLCGTTTSRQTKSVSEDYVCRYIMKDLPVAVFGEGVKSAEQIALVTQTEPEEQDSVYNDPYNQFQDGVHDIVPEPTIRSGDYPVTQYTTSTEKGLHSTMALAYFSDTVSGVTLPTIIPADNSFTVNFATETKKEGAMSKYNFGLSYSRKLASDWEFGCSWTPLAWNAKGSGFDNGSVYFKYQIFKNKANALAVNARAEFPTGTPKFSSVGIQPELKLSYSYYLPEKWSLTGNLSAKDNTNKNHAPSYVNINYALQLGKAFEKDFVALTFGGKNRDNLINGVCTNYLEGFYSRTLAPDQSISLAVRKGMTGGKRTDWKFTVGYSLTF